MVTTSVGVAQLLPEDDNLEALIGRADQALYAAKNSGRNRVVVWGEELAPVPVEGQL
jgi:diguanylate cyclase (GGDEF)-like protein